MERRNVQRGVPAEPEYDLASQQHTCPMKTWGISRALVPWIPNPSIFSSRNRLRIINIEKLGKLHVTHARACVRVRERERESYERGLWRRRELRRGLGLWRLSSACNLRLGRPCDRSVSNSSLQLLLGFCLRLYSAKCFGFLYSQWACRVRPKSLGIN